MNINVLGIDLAKNVFQLHGIDATGKTVLRKKLTRAKLAVFIIRQGLRMKNFQFKTARV